MGTMVDAGRGGPIAATRRGGTPLTILVLSGNRPAQLLACLESLIGASRPAGTEVLVALNGPQPEIEKLMSDVRSRLPELRILHVAPGQPGRARTAAIREARGDIIHFLDDDVTVDERLFDRILATFEQDPTLAAVGGPNLTPLGSTLFQQVAGAVLGSLVCAFPVRRRYSAQRASVVDERSLILCNLAVRRELLERIPFDASLVCAEENAFLRCAARQGARFFYRPDAFVRHERRPTFGSHLQQLSKYGRGRGQLMRRDFALSMFVYLVPLAATFCVAGGIVAGVLGPPWVLTTTLAAVALYLAATGATAAVVARRLHRLVAFPVASILLPATHLAYAFGTATGLLRPRRSNPAAPVPERMQVEVLGSST